METNSVPGRINRPSALDALSAIASHIAETGKAKREADRKRLLELGDADSRIANSVRLRFDLESLINSSFLNGLTFEAQGEQMLFAARGNGLTYEPIPVPMLRTEAGDLWTQLQPIVASIDPEKEALLLFSEDVTVTEQEAGKPDARRPYRLLKVSRVRVAVEIKGIPLHSPRVEKDASMTHDQEGTQA